jgi:hypothetical protein
MNRQFRFPLRLDHADRHGPVRLRHKSGSNTLLIMRRETLYADLGNRDNAYGQAL